MSFTSLAMNAQNSRNLLWEISGNGLQKPSYVFGTIHMICEDDYLMTPVIENTLKNVDAYYAEINLSDMKDMMTLQEAMKVNEPLSKRLTNQQYEEMKKLLQGQDIDIKKFENMSLIGIMSTLSMKSFSCEKFKLYEMELFKIAMTEGKKMGGLETASEQIKFMNDNMTFDTLIKMLRDMNEEKESTTTKLTEYYLNQDIDKLVEVIEQESYMTDEIYQELLSKRNHRWIDRMSQQMNNLSIFYAVGSGHLGGKNGLLELLRQKGFTVKPIELQ